MPRRHAAYRCGVPINCLCPQSFSLIYCMRRKEHQPVVCRFSYADESTLFDWSILHPEQTHPLNEPQATSTPIFAIGSSSKNSFAFINHDASSRPASPPHQVSTLLPTLLTSHSHTPAQEPANPSQPPKKPIPSTASPTAHPPPLPSKLPQSPLTKPPIPPPLKPPPLPPTHLQPPDPSPQLRRPPPPIVGRTASGSLPGIPMRLCLLHGLD